MTVRGPQQLQQILGDEPGLIFVAGEVSDEWEAVRAELVEAFEFSQQAAAGGEAIIYVVRTDDLLGGRGAGNAMVATGLLSAARTASLEMAKAGVAVNVLAVSDDTSIETIAVWVRRLVEPGGPSGELVHIGVSHVGKSLA